MRKRDGYVSNSSSSSFLVAYKGIGVFDKFDDGHVVQGYPTPPHAVFVRDIQDEGNQRDEKVVSFLYNQYQGLFDDFVYTMKEKGLVTEEDDCHWKVDYTGLMDEFSQLLSRLGMKNNLLDANGIWDLGIVHTIVNGTNEVTANISSFIDGNYDWEEDNRGNAREFAEVVLDRLKKKYGKVCVIRYSDNESELEDYMEHEFMEMVEKQADGEEYSVFIQNEH